MTTNAKVLNLTGELVDELQKRLSLLSLTVSGPAFDTDQNPYFQIGTGAIGAKGGIVKVKPIDWPLVQDVIGLPQKVFTPSEIQLCTESGAVAGTDVNGPAELLQILGAIQARGTRVSWYKTANGTAPTVAAIIPANFKTGWEPSLYHPLTNSQ